MPSLRKIRGRYYAYFYDPTRTPKRKSVALRTGLKTAAEAKLRRLEVEYAKGIFNPWNPQQATSDLKLRDAGERFLEDRNHLRPKSRAAYRSVITGLERLCPKDILLADVTPGDVARYVDAKDVSQSTRRHRAQHLRVFFRWAVKVGLLTEDAMSTIRMPKRGDKVPQFLSPEEVERLLKAIDDDAAEKRGTGLADEREITWIKDAIVFALNTGVRRGELVRLDWEAVDFASGWFTVRTSEDFLTKSGHERRLPLSADALDVLLQLHREHGNPRSGPVFRGVKGDRVNAEYLSKRFKYYVRRAGLPERIRFHSLRHTFASWMVQRGVSLPIVSAVLGHSDIQVTQQYAHLAPDLFVGAIERTFGKKPT